MRLRRARPRRAVRRLVDAGYESNEEPEPVAAHSLLPPELWMKIFIAVVPFNTAVFRLSGVCRLWREVRLLLFCGYFGGFLRVHADEITDIPL